MFSSQSNIVILNTIVNKLYDKLKRVNNGFISIIQYVLRQCFDIEFKISSVLHTVGREKYFHKVVQTRYDLK